MDSMWDSDSSCHGFECQCCQLADYVTFLGKVFTPCFPLPGEGIGTTRLTCALDMPLTTQWCPQCPIGVVGLTFKVFFVRLFLSS